MHFFKLLIAHNMHFFRIGFPLNQDIKKERSVHLPTGHVTGSIAAAMNMGS